MVTKIGKRIKIEALSSREIKKKAIRIFNKKWCDFQWCPRNILTEKGSLR